MALILLSITSGCQPAVVGSGQHSAPFCDVNYKIFDSVPKPDRNTARRTADASLRCEAYELSVSRLNPILRKDGNEVMTYLYASTFAIADGFVREKPSGDPGIDRAAKIAFCLPDLLHTLETTPAATIDLSKQENRHPDRLKAFARFLAESKSTRWTGWCKGYWIEATLTLNDEGISKLAHPSTTAPSNSPSVSLLH
jgi:hypothetical protein